MNSGIQNNGLEGVRQPAQSKSPISIIVSDLSRMRCDLLARELTRLQPRFRIVGHAVTVAELLELAERNPDVGIISGALREGALAGFSALRQLHALQPSMRKVMLLDSCEQDLVLAAFRGGARGVFSRCGSLDEFTRCIDRVYQGQIWVGNMELEFILGALSMMAPLRVPVSRTVLTRREEQIVALVANVASYHEIARRLNIAEHVVRESLSRIFSKLGIQSRAELVLDSKSLQQSDPTASDANSAGPSTAALGKDPASRAA